MTYAGVRWMTSRGNEELAARAKHTFEAAVIGIIITVSAYGISNFVLSRLGAGSGGLLAEQVAVPLTNGLQIRKQTQTVLATNILCDNGKCISAVQ